MASKEKPLNHFIESISFMASQTLIKKIYYQGTHRGMREVDVLLRPLMSTLQKLSNEKLLIIQDFLDENDQDILKWVLGMSSAPHKYQFLLDILRRKV